jgi:hypothetical protein
MGFGKIIFINPYKPQLSESKVSGQTDQNSNFHELGHTFRCGWGNWLILPYMYKLFSCLINLKKLNKIMGKLGKIVKLELTCPKNQEQCFIT